jgi:hypothetical protein
MPSYRPEISVLTRFTSALSYLRGWGLVALVAALLPACSPEIGDDCATALDCSASGTRLCDMTQRGGYCTLEGCEENTCPEEAVCVSFGRRFEGQSVERLARPFCMLKCDSDSDCRTDDNYGCFAARSSDPKAKTFGAGDEAQILGNSKQKFCAQNASTFVLPDAGMSEMPEPDAAMSLPPEEDDAGAASEDDAGSAAP